MGHVTAGHEIENEVGIIRNERGHGGSRDRKSLGLFLMSVVTAGHEFENEVGAIFNELGYRGSRDRKRGWGY